MKDRMQMKHAWNRILVGTVGAGVLWGGLALAQSSPRQERAQNKCVAMCAEDVETCTKVCKKRVTAGSEKCTEICKQAQKECEAECDSPGGK